MPVLKHVKSTHLTTPAARPAQSPAGPAPLLALPVAEDSGDSRKRKAGGQNVPRLLLVSYHQKE